LLPFFTLTILVLEEEILITLTSFSLILSLNFKSFTLSFILSLVLDSFTLNNLKESISSPFTTSSSFISSPLKAKKTKGGKTKKRKK
jgi:hypothetical protein